MADGNIKLTASMRNTCEGCGVLNGKTVKWLCRSCSAESVRVRRLSAQRSARGRLHMPPSLRAIKLDLSTTRTRHICVVCGCGFYPKQADRVKCCGRECGLRLSGFIVGARKNGGRVSVSEARNKCQTCGKRSNKSGQYCSDTCKPIRPIVSYYIPIVASTCRWCSLPFMRDDAKSTRYFCSCECQAAAKRKSTQPAKKKRRAMKRGANGGENVSPDVVFARDAWRCGLCGKKTDRSKRGSTHPRAPELDHIIPVSKGGLHTYANTQCSCRSCNGAKGARVRGQLSLFPMG